MKTAFATLAMLASIALGSPIETSGPIETAKPVLNARDDIIPADVGTAVNGALDAIPVTVKAVAPPATMTMSIINSAGVVLTTTHGYNSGAVPVVGNSAPGTIAVGATAVAAMQTGWAGNVAFNDARWPILGDVESLIEGSFVTWPGTVNENTGVISLDVSYVSGFSMPISCFCGSQTGKYLSGCDKNLWALNPCPDDQNNAAGSCRNPRRYQADVLSALPFFSACAGLAYTYPVDEGADSANECQEPGVITCVVYPSH
ncbi:hypothetical protein B0T25DRAFT_569175 [Lasiosphaeria hispida]|uniref:Thaumatin-like protein n=1 Tax=Lasiosphaeria hispida TaxID=260671 RepID=A0AAJ0HJW2_9PEZI|nr:hypothetical protein B0T25DRAFT_569175 [Lasiosphaeria hispida]